MSISCIYVIPIFHNENNNFRNLYAYFTTDINFDTSY